MHTRGADLIRNSAIWLIKSSNQVNHFAYRDRILLLSPLGPMISQVTSDFYSMISTNIKGKVTVLSPHPSSELCSADFDKYLPWSLGLLLSISVWITISTPWGVYSRSHATWRHGLQICPHRYPFPPGSREAMQREVPCSGAQRPVAPAGYCTRDLT